MRRWGLRIAILVLLAGLGWTLSRTVLAPDPVEVEVVAARSLRAGWCAST